MISAWWLLTLVPAAWFGFCLCALLVVSKGGAETVLWSPPTETAGKYKPCDCGATIVHRDITGLWWQCAGCGKRLEEEV
jgi:hypothetical protein